MSQALFTGATGLRAYQRQLEVVANNLANLNTTGFKSQSVLFSDLVYRTIRAAAGSNGVSFGGVNAAQAGTGVQVAQVNRNYNQAALLDTGQPLDFAIRGNGFFVLRGADSGNLFSRAGSFSLDENGFLVDPATGLYVQRFGTVGDPVGDEFGFQTAGDSRINIPFGEPIPGAETNTISFQGNLPSSADPPQAEVLGTATAFETDTGPAELTTTFSELTSNQSDYVAGDLIEVSGTGVDGTPFDFTIPADTGTLADLVDGINAELTDATAVLDADGGLTITANDTGEAFLSLSISDAETNANLTDFENHALVIETEGGSGDTFESVSQIFDVQGNSRNVLFTFRKTSFNGWEVTTSLQDNDGLVINDQTYQLQFEDDGTFSTLSSSATDDDLDLRFNSLTLAQTIEIDFESISHRGGGIGLSQSQDGFPPGVLANVDVSGDGSITAIGSNGTFFPIAQLAIASFANVEGLEALGDNFFAPTSASGVTQIGGGLDGGRGSVVGGQLESSNVDITQEFAQLIIAQRAFSANARTISVSDEILEELTNLIR